MYYENIYDELQSAIFCTTKLFIFIFFSIRVGDKKRKDSKILIFYIKANNHFMNCMNIFIWNYETFIS